MSDAENHHHGKNEIIIVKRHGGGHEAAHGGAWKIAYADFMTAMMAFFLVMWLVNAANEETKASIASYFNPVPLSDDTPASKGLKKPSNVAKGEATEEKSDVENDKVGGGKAGIDGDAVSMTGDDQNYSEADLFKNPYTVLSSIAQEVGQQANVSTKGEGGASNSGPATGADGGQAYRDPFDPDFWSKQLDAKSGSAMAKDSGLPGQSQSAFDKPSQQAEQESEAAAASQVASAAPSQQAKDAAAGATQAGASQPGDTKSDKTSPADGQAKDQASAGGPVTQKQEAQKAEALQKEIQGAVAGVAGKLAEGIVVQPSEGGTLITISDKANTAMFGVGSAVPDKELVLAMEKIGKVLAERKGSVIIRGHTDGRPYKGATEDNWTLSMNRAHAAYYMLIRGGLDEERVKQVSGYADRRLQVPSDPMNGANRRIEILLGNG